LFKVGTGHPSLCGLHQPEAQSSLADTSRLTVPDTRNLQFRICSFYALSCKEMELSVVRTYFLLAVYGVSLLVLVAGKADAGPVLDQIFVLDSWPFDGLAGSGHLGAPRVTQTFTVGITGTLTVVALPLTNLRVSSVVTVAIYRTSGGLPISGSLGTASVDASSLPDDPSAPFTKTERAMFEYGSKDIPVTAGEQMAMILSATEPHPGESGVGYYGATGYPGGHISVDIGSGPMSLFPYSMFFQTYVEPAAVPEPASEALLGTSLLGFFLLRWPSRHHGTDGVWKRGVGEPTAGSLPPASHRRKRWPSTRPILEQHHRARPSRDQTPGQRQARLRGISGGPANHSGL
jgi:hypothetical protein